MNEVRASQVVLVSDVVLVENFDTGIFGTCVEFFGQTLHKLGGPVREITSQKFHV